jgi:hypothetical protein
MKTGRPCSIAKTAGQQQQQQQRQQQQQQQQQRQQLYRGSIQ